MQFEQLLAKAALYVPATHTEQDVAPVEAVYDPAAQGKQAVLPLV